MPAVLTIEGPTGIVRRVEGDPRRHAAVLHAHHTHFAWTNQLKAGEWLRLPVDHGAVYDQMAMGPRRVGVSRESNCFRGTHMKLVMGTVATALVRKRDAPELYSEVNPAGLCALCSTREIDGEGRPRLVTGPEETLEHVLTCPSAVATEARTAAEARIAATVSEALEGAQKRSVPHALSRSLKVTRVNDPTLTAAERQAQMCVLRGLPRRASPTWSARPSRTPRKLPRSCQAYAEWEKALFLDPVFSPSATQSGLASSAADAIAVSLDPVSGRLVLQAHSASSSTGTQREQLAFPDLLLCLQLLAFQISTDTMLPAEERCRRLEALSRLQYEIIVLARTLPWERVFPWVQHHLADALACAEDADGRYRALGHHSMALLARSLPEGGLGLGGPLPFHAGSIVASAAAVDAAARPAGGGRASRASAAARPAAASAVAALASPPGTAPSGDTRAASGSGRSRSRAVQDALDRGAVWHTEDPRYFGVSPAICWCFNQGICKNAVSDGVCFFGRHICAQRPQFPLPAARQTRSIIGALRRRWRPLWRQRGQDVVSVVSETRSSSPTGSTSAASIPERRVSTATAVDPPHDPRSIPAGSSFAASAPERPVSTATAGAAAHAPDPRSIPAGSSFASSTPERPTSAVADAAAPAGTRARAHTRIRKQPLAPPFDTTVPTYPTSAVGGAPLPSGLAPTPVHLPNLLAALADHPDPTLATRLAQGFTRGFPLLYRGPPYSAVHRPHPTALEHLDAVRADVAKERAAGRMAGPFPHPPFAPFVASPLGAVPKKRSNPPKWRRITDLSYPRFRGFSVNRGIDNAPLHYTSPSVADAIELIISLGRLTQLGKADVRDAFRLLPVRPEDYWLLGAALPSEDPARPGAYDFYYDMALPFGGRSSPRTFEDLGQALDHALRRGGVLFLRYVDDILVLGRPGTAECARSMEALQAICSHLGIPLAAEKLEGPAFRLVFLGIELDTDAMEARLSAGRYEDLVSLLGSWEGKRHATRHDLQALAGLLTSATAVIPPGRFFLQRVLSLISALRKDHHRATLHPGFHADLRWWRFLLAERHGVRLLPASARWADSRELRLETDASGVGFGAVFGDAWLFGAWADHPDIPASMPWRELMAIVIAAVTWGPVAPPAD
eukprot:tig00020801_g13987.t1